MCDFGPTQFEEVRRAIAYIVDRDEITKKVKSTKKVQTNTVIKK